MLTGHFFKRLKRRRARRGSAHGLDGQAFLADLCDQTVRRFARISYVTVVAAPVDLRRMEDSEEPVQPLMHPECAEFAKNDYCRESWQLHLAELSRDPETHWHRCDYGHRCAVVPLVFQNKCVALFKLACPDSVPESEFEAHVELLDLLVEQVAATEAEALGRLFPPEQPCGHAGDPSSPSPEAGEDPAQAPSHPQVLKAIEYVEHSLSDPKLTVHHVADVLGIHPDYLASLFRKEVGQRMSRYISARRIERAKNLLVTTHWRVKRIAYETGFANSKWFYHVFQTHTGLTPDRYRRKERR